MKTRKELAEYLFLDEQRIERYFQQLSAPIQYDKVPIWKVALGITGPSVEGTQNRVGREFSFNEKLQKVLGHMESEELLSKGRPAVFDQGEGREKPFVTETIRARRVNIKREERTLSIWVSLRPKEELTDERIEALYLIEDFRGRDDYPNILSSYSSFFVLATELDGFDVSLTDPIHRLAAEDHVMQRFASDPISSLKSIGGQFGPERHIDTIYRIRATCGARESDGKICLTTVGYPLVIREALRSQPRGQFLTK